MLEIQLKTQDTPNPDAKKFILNFEVKRTGRISYVHSEECAHVPLAHKLLAGDYGIVQVHFFQKALTITKSEDRNWNDIEQPIKQLILAELPDHDPDFQEKTAAKNENFCVEMQLMDGILDREIRPFLQADGGDLQLLGYEHNILTIRYEGACGGCPSAQMGTLDAITQLLRVEFNPQIEVVTL